LHTLVPGWLCQSCFEMCNIEHGPWTCASHRVVVLLCRWLSRRFSALWINPDDLAEEGLLLSRHMLFDHFPDRALDIIQRTLRDIEDSQHSLHDASDAERSYTAPCTQSVSYVQQNYHTGQAGHCPPNADMLAPHVMTPHSQTAPDVRDTEVSVSMPAVGSLAPPSTRSRKPQSAAALQQVSAGGVEINVAMSSASALSRVSSSGMIGL
jgi:hypothetical protein